MEPFRGLQSAVLIEVAVAIVIVVSLVPWVPTVLSYLFGR